MENYFTNHEDLIIISESVSVIQQNPNVQPDLFSPSNPSPVPDPKFEIAENIEQQCPNDEPFHHDNNYQLLLQNFNKLKQHSCSQEHLLQLKDADLAVLRDNETYLRTELGSLQQKYLSQNQKIQNLVQELEALKNNTVLKDLPDEVLQQNRPVPENEGELDRAIEDLMKYIQLVGVTTDGREVSMEELNSQLARENAQIMELNSQLKSTKEQFNLLSDQCQKLARKVEELGSENERLATKVLGLEEEKKGLEKERDDLLTFSQFLQDLKELLRKCTVDLIFALTFAAERDQLKEEGGKKELGGKSALPELHGHHPNDGDSEGDHSLLRKRLRTE